MVMQFIPPPVTILKPPFAAGLSGTYTSNSVSGTTSTFDIGFGDPETNRIIVLAMGWQTSGNISATIGGVPAIVLPQVLGTNACAGILYAKVPNGTTGTVVLTKTNAFSGSLIVAAFRIVGQNNDVPYGSGVSAGGGAANRTATIDVAAGGIAMAVGSGSTNAITSNAGTVIDDGSAATHKVGHVYPTPLLSGATFTHNGRGTAAASWR